MNKKLTTYFKFGCLIIIPLFFSCSKEKTLFEKISPEESGITFTNQVIESEKENILNYEYFYNGGGVASGDFNNDGLIDLYFTGNQVDNKLYLNKGALKFEDITEKSGTAGRKNGWKTGVSLVDINADGWLDIYVCYSGLRDSTLRKNQLFINNHNLNGSSPRFSEKASEYGLDDSGYSTQAAFLDYDLDGDLDCFLVNHNLAGYQRKEASVMRNAYDYNAGDKLFRNDGNERFTDISKEAGIKSNPLGFGLGVMVSDINKDGYPDIYVTNDYVEDDYLYINQQGKSFKDELRERITHTSYSSMGVDIADLNNDGLSDIFTLDMLPESNSRQKLLLWADNWNTYQAQLQNGFWHANMRNMLQMNQGNGGFSEIGQLAGVSNTDWSWGTLLADFDMDGYKDIFVSNGIGRDYTNADFIKYFNDEESTGSQKPLLEQVKLMPTSQTKNYIFKNNQNLNNATPQFTNEQKNWGFDEPTVASGCVYADLDNDGDLELITNNLNEPSRIYKNTQQENNPKNFIRIKLKGSALNPFGIGAKITIKANQNIQTQEVSPTHGFQSSSIGDILFA
ncbi:MAG: CRTAC1 family protein, partial [Bacteroidota bacterium]